MDLRVIPDHIVRSARAVAANYGETLVGWKYITDELPVIRYMVVTNAGYYEINDEGIVIRAAVLHKFPPPYEGNESAIVQMEGEDC